MQKVFEEVGFLDQRCYDEFELSEDILMEHAAIGMMQHIKDKFKKQSNILIISGTGNNGADGIALARMLHKDYKITLYIPFGAKSNMAKLQYKRALKVGVEIIDDKSYKLPLKSYDIIVDCLFGTGLKRPLLEDSKQLIQGVNNLDAYKIACDIPSGILSPLSMQVSNIEAIF